MLAAIALGFLLGYIGSIPAAGPLAVLVATASLAGRSRRVLGLAVGGAVAEGLWALAAARGLGWVMEKHAEIERGLRVGGGAIAITMGFAIALLPATKGEKPAPDRAASSVVVGFALVALNPSFLVTWVASCALLRAYPSVASAATPAHAPFLSLGAVVGVVGWFMTLDALIRRFRGGLATLHQRLVRGLGWLLVAGGTIALVRGVMAG